MVTSLLDINLLIALFWPAHEAHIKAQRWFAENARHGWATCAITQTGFVRIISNPSFSRRAVSPHDALSVLASGVEHPDHLFWTDDIGVPKALDQFGDRLQGHQQVTDAYLLALALQKKGCLATLDSAIPSLLPAASAARRRVVLV